jgi:bifunctional ADP-heptose synthase (sugar kinase/adenylyltransferase)
MSPIHPLNTAIVEQILERIPALTIGVVGDLFLDRYLDLDATLTEPSVETGLDAYQVVRVRASPGAAGTVINNLAALGVGRICPLAVIGDDGEGYELRQALTALGVVDLAGVLICAGRRTPTYTKPMLQRPGETARELNRLDIKNRTPLPVEVEDQILSLLRGRISEKEVNALVVLDQVREEDCGVCTRRVRDCLAELGRSQPDRFILADSRERIGLFRGVSLKPNQSECLRAGNGQPNQPGKPAGSTGEAGRLESALRKLAGQAGRPVFCTCGERGILLFDPGPAGGNLREIPAYPVTGPVDIVGAGDSTSAGIVCAVACGATWEQAAAFGNLVASITVQQIGTTGTATPAQVRQRWCSVAPVTR